MTPAQALMTLYNWAELRALPLFAGSFLLPLVVVVLARLVRREHGGGLGERIANLLILSSVAVLVVSLLLAMIAQWAFGASLWHANLWLLLAPPTFLLTSVVGIRLIFPLNRLASIHMLKDVGIFLGACLGVIWLIGQFRGWGVIFFGGTLQLLVIGVGLYWLLRRLWLQARGKR